jgi:hypothetical protein
MISTLHGKHEKNYWVVDSGCSHHMTNDKINFVKNEKYDGCLVMFGDDIHANIFGIGLVIYNGKHSTDDVYYIKCLRNNILSVEHMCSKGYNLVKCEIKKGSKTIIVVGENKKGNIYKLKDANGNLFIS